MSSRSRRGASRVAEGVLPLVLAGAALGLLFPSSALANRTDVLLAIFVLVTVLGIEPSELLALRHRWRTVALLSVAPFVALVPVAYALGRLFESPTREGVLALGLGPTEVAAVGLAALAARDATLVLATVIVSFVVSAIAGPPLASALAAGEANTGALLVRFALVLILPLAVGLVARGTAPAIEHYEPFLEAAASFTIAVLVYAALGDLDTGNLVATLAASGAFLAASAVIASLATCVHNRDARENAPFVIALRDFAVAAALAAQAFGGPAAAVPAVYGVLMLLAGTALARTVQRSAAPAR